MQEMVETHSVRGLVLSGQTSSKDSFRACTPFGDSGSPPLPRRRRLPASLARSLVRPFALVSQLDARGALPSGGMDAGKASEKRTGEREAQIWTVLKGESLHDKFVASKAY